MQGGVTRTLVQFNALAWRQLVAALEDGSALGRFVLQALDSTQGFLIGSLDSTAHPEKILAQLRSGGVSRERGAAASAMQWLGSETSRFLGTSADACCVIENRHARKGDTSLHRFAQPPIALETGDVVHLLSSATSCDEVLDVLKKAAALPHTAIFWIRRRDAEQLPASASELAARCERVFVWVCDGEAYIELSVTHSSSG